MKKLQFLSIGIFLNIYVFGQINMTDSTAQVIGYWNKNEKQSYIITQEKYKIKDLDTISRDFYKYTVDVSIIDSTANSYIIDWHYKDYEINSENKIVQRLSSITDNMTIRIKTDELGSFQEVINWRDIRSYILKGTKILKKETQNIPNMNKFIQQLEGIYNSKESIELGAIKEIQQFYTFHGAQYELGMEYNADMKVGNLYGKEPFDANITVWLDELNPDNNNFIIRMKQTVDTEQLTNVTFDYLTNMAKTLKTPLPERDKFPSVTNDTWTASRIHGSGWIIYSIETKEVRADGVTSIEERIIDIQ